MSRLTAHDAYLHYEDGSHRWTSPDGEVSDMSWRLRVEAHVQQHRAAVEAEGGPVRYARALTRDPEVDDDLLGGLR